MTLSRMAWKDIIEIDRASRDMPQSHINIKHMLHTSAE